MKKHIIYSYVPTDTNLIGQPVGKPGDCDVYLLVPLDQFTTTLKPDKVLRTKLEGIGKYGYKNYLDYEAFKVPGSHKYYLRGLPMSGVVISKKIKRFVNKNFSRILKEPPPIDILYGFVGEGDVVINNAVVYALVPKSQWKPGSNGVITRVKGLRLFHGYDTPDQDTIDRCYYIIEVPGITECTNLEIYQEDIMYLYRFESTLEKI